MSNDNTAAQPAGPRRPDDPMWTAERIRALGVITDLKTAGSIFGLSRAVAYDLARRNQFPVPLIRVGARYRVPIAAILTVLHMVDQPPNNTRDLTRPAHPSVDRPTDQQDTPAAQRPPTPGGTPHE
jgi:hypothetical protein